MRKIARWFIVMITVLGAGLAQATTHDFYKAKTIRIIVGNPAGDLYDLWARLVGTHMAKLIPGNPDIIVQNMPGAGGMIAANYIYNVGKPDGLTLGMFLPALYMDQLVGRKEVQFDWARFAWIGSPVKGEHQMYMRTDAPFKTVEDIRKATMPPKCGTTGTGSPSYYIPKLMEENLGAKFSIVSGYPGGQDIDLAVERGEIQCRAFTIEAFFAREPFTTWRKTGFVRNIVQTGRTRDPRLADTPTIYELMDQYKTPETGRRLAAVLLAGGALGRPLVGPPGIAPDRIRSLREAYTKTMSEPGFLDEIKRRRYELDPTSGAELETIAKEAVAQPPEVVARMQKLLGK